MSDREDGGTPQVFRSAAARRRFAVYLIVTIVVVAALFVALPRYLPWLTEPEEIRLAIRSYGPFAPAVFVAVQATQVIVAPIPGQVLGFVAGFLFGTVAGTAYSLLGAAIGSYVVFRLSRQYGRAYVERTVEQDWIDRFDDAADRRGLLALFVVFLVPGLPDDAICFVFGLTELRIRDMVVVSVLGRLPGYAMVAAAGAQLAANRLRTMALLVGVLAVLTVLGYVWRDELLRRFADRSR